MKKLLVIALSAIMILACAAIAMADISLTGEIDTGYKGATTSDVDNSMPYIFGKVNVAGKLGDSVTGLMVIKSNSDPACPSTEKLENNFQFDEADFTIAESFGTLKFGYYGWNNNLKDIIDPVRGDVKSYFVSSAALKITDNFTLGLAYSFKGTDNASTIVTVPAIGDVTSAANTAYGDTIDGQFGIDLGYATDSFGVDLIYTDKNAASALYTSLAGTYSTTGIQAYYLINGFKPYVQYEKASFSESSYDDVANTIVGFIYDNADVPFYGRVEYDASDDFGDNHMTGVRVGYKLANGIKLEAQDYTNIKGTEDKADYFKIICAF
jgi:hypothetical protein